MSILNKSIRFFASRLMSLSPGEPPQVAEMPVTINLALSPKRGITVGTMTDFTCVTLMLEQLVRDHMTGRVLLGPSQHHERDLGVRPSFLVCEADAASLATYLAHEICPKLCRHFSLRLDTLKVTWGVLEAAEATPKRVAVLQTPWDAPFQLSVDPNQEI